MGPGALEPRVGWRVGAPPRTAGLGRGDELPALGGTCAPALPFKPVDQPSPLTTCLQLEENLRMELEDMAS